MTLALAIVACLAIVAAASAWAARSDGRGRRAQTLLVALAPLGAFLVISRAGPPGGARHWLRVVGAYAPLADTVAIGGTAADLRLAAPSMAGSTAGSRLRAWYDRPTRSIAVRVDSGVAPVALDGRIVNAVPFAGGARLTLTARAGLTLDADYPRWPLACLVHAEGTCDVRALTLRDGGGIVHRATVRVPRAGLTAAELAGALGDRRLARAPFLLMATDDGVRLVASPAGPVRIDGHAVPNDARAAVHGDGAASGAELRVGGESGAAMQVRPDTIANRLELRFAGRTRGERWPVSTSGTRTVTRVVAGVDPGPGTLPLLDLDDAAPLGGRARPYAGAIEWHNGAFRWYADGKTRLLRPGRVERLPGTGAARVERGHLVELTAGAAAAPTAIAALALVWAMGALVLALGGAPAGRVATAGATAGALRVAVIGLVYVLALVRAAIAYRVTVAEPFNAEALPWAAVFLAVFPVLVVLLERWPVGAMRRLAPATWATSLADVRHRIGTFGAGSTGGPGVAGAAAALVALVVVAGTLVAAAGPLRMQAAHAALGAVVLVVGTVGLLLLQRALVASDAGGFAEASPFGMLLPRAERGFGAPQAWRAFAALFVVFGLYVALAWSVRGVPSPLLAVAYAGAVGVVYAAVWTRERPRARIPAARVARYVAIAGAATSLAVGFAASVAFSRLRVPVLVGIGAIGGTIAVAALWAALAPLVRPLRGWPHRRDDVLPPLQFALLPVVLILGAEWGGLRRMAITLGYALALGTLLLLTRVFAGWWHRGTGSRVREQLGAAPDRLPVGLLVGPLIGALVVYLAYGAVDRGLLLLLMVAALLATTIASATVGRAALLVSAAATAAVLTLGIPRMITVAPAGLRAAPMTLNTPQMRYAAVRAPAALARQLALSTEAQGREIVNTLQQDWGMRAYAAGGGTAGEGFFSTSFARAAIPEEVALTDNAFSVWVLGEHGFVGGIAVLAAYLALALTLLWGAHVAARRAETAQLALLLAGLAAYLAVPALYMIAANTELLPLTGQNLPLLGLRSGADVAFVAWLTALAVVALPVETGGAAVGTEQDEVRRRDLRRLRATLVVAAGAVVVSGVVVGRAAWRVTHADVQPFALDAFADDLRGLVARGDLERRGDTLAIAAQASGKVGLREGDLVRAVVQRSNAFARGAAPARRHCLERGPWLTWRGAAVDVSELNCRISALPAGERWRGALVAGSAPRELLLTGLATPVVLGDGYAPEVLVRCGAAAPNDTIRARAVQVACGTGGAIAEVTGGRAPTLRAHSSAVRRNGETVGAGGVGIAAGDVLTLDSSATIVVDSLPARALGFARWRNGTIERVAASGAPPLAAALDSVLATSLSATRAGVTGEVALTLDVGLGRELQARLADRCAALGHAGGGASSDVRRCSAIVVDPTTGDILALASWERPGTTRRAFESAEPNFRAHRPGSVVKPIFAAAVLARYPALSRLAVAQPADTFSVAAGWPLGGRPMHGARNGCATPSIDWRCFLPNSNNRFAVTLGLLGLATEPAAGALPVLDPTVPVGGAVTLDGRPLAGRPRLPRDRPAGYLTSPLARNLDALFGVRVGRQPSGAFDESLWRAAREHELLRTGATWQRVSPALPSLPLDGADFRDVRHVAGFLIGETDNAWSNAALAQSVSRLLTGRAVELRLLRRVGTTALPPATAPALPFGPGREAVLEGMRGVVHGTGTAREVGGLFAAPTLDLIGKTGTLESDALEPLSAFLWAGRGRVPNAAGAARVCAAAGIVVIEMEPRAAERLRAASVFADVVAPSLRDHFGWGEQPCDRDR